jgi:hypothetical protein
LHFERIENQLRWLWNKGTQNLFTQLTIGFGLAISVYIGFYLGFAIQQMDRVGQAMITIGANNSTTDTSSWISQAAGATNNFPYQTLWYALLLLPLLVIPNLTYRHHASIFTSIVFPVFVAGSWLILTAATLPPSLPQSFVTVVGIPKEANIGVNQIQAFIFFEQSFVFSLQTLTIITATWVSTRFVGKSKYFFVNVFLLAVPFFSWFFTPTLPFLHIPGIIYSAITNSLIVTPLGAPYVTVGGFFPSYLGSLNDFLLRITLLLWTICGFNYFSSRPTYPKISRFSRWIRSIRCQSNP